jgi:LysM repeat protein
MVVVATLALAGCDMTDKQDAQYDDPRNPYYKKAQQDVDNNPQAAIDDYEQALGANPKLTEAHYQMGHIYADKLNDPIGAIYHFEQYLRLAPTGTHADDAKALIDKESQAFAASLPNSAPQSADEYAKLQADNATLHKQVEDATHTIVKLQAQLSKHHHEPALAAATAPAPAPGTDAAASTNAATATAPSPTAESSSSSTPAPAVAASTPAEPTTNDASAATNAVSAAPPRALPLDATNVIAGIAPGGTNAPADAGPSRTYKVVSGDSLWKIAHKMYPGDTKNGIDKIKDANKDTLPEGKPLKIGQVLIIPQ